MRSPRTASPPRGLPPRTMPSATTGEAPLTPGRRSTGTWRERSRTGSWCWDQMTPTERTTVSTPAMRVTLSSRSHASLPTCAGRSSCRRRGRCVLERHRQAVSAGREHERAPPGGGGYRACRVVGNDGALAGVGEVRDGHCVGELVQIDGFAFYSRPAEAKPRRRTRSTSARAADHVLARGGRDELPRDPQELLAAERPRVPDRA